MRCFPEIFPGDSENQEGIKFDPPLPLVARNRHALPYSNSDGNRPNPNSDSAAPSIPYAANASDLGPPISLPLASKKIQ